MEIDELGILEGETNENSYKDVVKFLGVPYAETPKEPVFKIGNLQNKRIVLEDPKKRFEHSKIKSDLGFFEAKNFRFGPAKARGTFDDCDQFGPN